MDAKRAPDSGLASERLELVRELGRRVTALLDPETLLRQACHLIADAFSYDTVGVNLIDPMDAGLLYQAATFPSDRQLPASFRVPLDRGLTGWVAKHGEPRLVNDVARDPLYIPGPRRVWRRSRVFSIEPSRRFDA